MLEKEGWSPVKIHGNSTNCLVPSLVEYTLYKRIDYHPELNLLRREVIADYLDKKKAKEDIKNIKDLSPTLRRIVFKKLEEVKTTKQVSE